MTTPKTNEPSPEMVAACMGEARALFAKHGRFPVTEFGVIETVARALAARDATIAALRAEFRAKADPGLDAHYAAMRRAAADLILAANARADAAEQTADGLRELLAAAYRANL